MSTTPLTSSLPEVESYDEEMYLCKTGDTTEAICEQYYHTRKYSRALLMFNRAHPRVADGIQKEPPTLTEGQPVFIPPARILEKQYAALITEPQVPPANPPVAVPAPAEAGSGAASASAQPVTAPGAKLYRVRPDGEMFYQIAQRTLGTGDRWHEIALLNPGFKVEYAVPGGSTLKLPADARIEAASAP
jgi:hypothetical protein